MAAVVGRASGFQNPAWALPPSMLSLGIAAGFNADAEASDLKPGSLERIMPGSKARPSSC